ncbi:hypothetical protein FACHB389_12055 [Nostoc calcicola FACHB-389]|nr:hypothetical protein FACHB389_12055 [Nostoc calcicola FACHB-389]
MGSRENKFSLFQVIAAHGVSCKSLSLRSLLCAFAPLRETKKYLCYYSNWKFLKLIGQVVEIDLGEHYISDIGKILGILSNILTEEVF